MKLEAPLAPEEAAPLFEQLRKDLENSTPQSIEKLVPDLEARGEPIARSRKASPKVVPPKTSTPFKTGSAALQSWQSEQEDLEEKRGVQYGPDSPLYNSEPKAPSA